MPIPTWSVGQVLAAADVNSWMVPLAAYKAIDQSVTSSTTLVNDTQLLVTVAANAVYAFDCFLNFEGSATIGQGIKWQVTVPAGAALRYHGVYTRSSDQGNITGDTYAGADVVAAIGHGSGNNCGASMNGTLFTSAAGGTVQIQWAQAASSATPTIVHDHSHMLLRRIA
jgi:hypothetical protein